MLKKIMFTIIWLCFIVWLFFFGRYLWEIKPDSELEKTISIIENNKQCFLDYWKALETASVLIRTQQEKFNWLLFTTGAVQP